MYVTALPTIKRRLRQQSGRMKQPCSTHAACSHLQVVNEPLVVKFSLFGVDRLRVDVDPPVGLGVHLNPVKVRASGESREANLYQNTMFHKL